MSRRVCTKTVVTLGIGAVSLMAVACSSNASGNADSSSSSASAASSGKTTLTFIQAVAANPYFITMGCGLKAEAQKYGNVQITTQAAAQYDPTLQIPIVNAVTANKPDGVIVAPTDVTALTQPLLQMQQHGIKIVQVDTAVNDSSVGVSAISSNNVQGGQAAADALGQLTGGSGQVLILAVTPGISSNEQRIQGFTAEIKQKFPNMSIIGPQYAGEDVGKSASVVSSVLSAHPGLKGIFTIDFFGATGAINALKSAGKSSAVKIVTFDATPNVVSALNAGSVQAVISQDPYEEGILAMQQMEKALNGQPTTPKILVPTKALTKANIDSPSSKPFIYSPTC